MTTTGKKHAFAKDLTASGEYNEFWGRRIIIYAMNYEPEVAGVGKYTGEIAEYFAQEGAAVSVVTTPPHYPGWSVSEGFRDVYSFKSENGVRVWRSPLLLKRKMSGIWRLLAPLSFAISSAPILFFEVLRQRPHAILCFEPTLFAAPAAQCAAWLVGARTILYVQDLEIDAAFAVGHLGPTAWLKKVGYSFERMVLRRFSGVITISNRMADKLSDKGVCKDRLEVVRNWIDLSHIYPLEGENVYRKKLNLKDDEFVVLYSGNIGAKQGLSVLLDAAEILKNEASLQFLIAGEGPCKEELRARYCHLKNVQFLPFQPYSQFNEFLNIANLHVLPQDKEAADLVLPSKLGGMLASGKPLIVTTEDGTELTEFLRGTAVITPPGNAQALANGIVATMRGDLKIQADEVRQELCQSLARESGLAAVARCVWG